MVALTDLSVMRTQVWMTEEIAVDRGRGARAREGAAEDSNWRARCRPPKALRVAVAGPRLAPYDPAVATETGKILLAEGQPDGALEEFGRALALDPRDARN